ncbi:unnamed protein product [Vicia faba]|uniref:Uncharacterized protein n=1 Tax=Vicia faba TaxID=3906 RepID=A0AAV1A942_VICFA|nr:unnamed protein product [Vicia faba]
MDTLIFVVGKVSEYTVAHIEHQASYLIRYKANFKMLTDDVKDLDDERQRMMILVEEERRNAWPFPNLISLHQLSRKATKLIKDVVQVQGKRVSGPVGYLSAINGVASSSSTRGDEKYETRESLNQEIIKALAALNLGNIGVYELDGVGKTTLVEEVFQLSKQHKFFDEVVTTHVSKNLDLKTI